MSKPQRVQLSRKKGWRKPENTVVVARPGKWGNPWPIGKEGPFGRALDAEGAVYYFREMFLDPELAEAAGYPSIGDIKEHLKGKNLACWCPLNKPCHADVLLELANDGPDE